MDACIIPGCTNPALSRIGVRCRVMLEGSRKSKTRAHWAPETTAWLCDEHATAGMGMLLVLRPNDTGYVSVGVIVSPPARRRKIT